MTVQTGSPQQVAGYVHVGSDVVIFLTYGVVKNGVKTNIERTQVLSAQGPGAVAVSARPNSEPTATRCLSPWR